MKLALQLAIKNLLGAGLRTWLNVGVLAFSFLIILFFNGLIDGWNAQARRDTINWEIANGKLLNKEYDPLDPFTVLDGHGVYEGNQSANLTPVLIRQASIYPDGRMVNIALKGMPVDQTVVELPTQSLKNYQGEGIPAMIGSKMAKSNHLAEGDQVLLRWRDKNGTFDAANISIVKVFQTDLGSVDRGQIWIPIQKLWDMTSLQGHASYLLANENYTPESNKNWTFQSQDDLLEDLDEIIAAKKSGGFVMYGLLLAIALLAIFDTQVLSVFRRQREIGTYVALGMTRSQVVTLFTVEGSMYSLFAMIVGSLIGLPLLGMLAKNGMAFPMGDQDFGIAMADRIYPVFTLGLVLSTIILVVISATIVSYLPSRRISKMDPVDALKGKLQ